MNWNEPIKRKKIPKLDRESHGQGLGDVADDRGQDITGEAGEAEPRGSDQDIDTAGTEADPHRPATLPPGQGKDPKRNTM